MQSVNTLRDVKAKVRAIVGDPNGDWLTDSYLAMLINQVYDLIILDLSETCSPYITRVVEIPNLEFGTTDLAQYQNSNNQPLYGLIWPFKNGLDWKPAGQPECYYRCVVQKDKLPNFSLSGPSPINSMYFEWREFVIYLTPLPFNVDLRVRGEFRPQPLIKETDVVAIHPQMAAVLAELTAACANRERANVPQSQAFTVEGNSGLDAIKNQLVRSQQGTSVRLGRMRGGRRGGGYGGWGNYGLG